MVCSYELEKFIIPACEIKQEWQIEQVAALLIIADKN
jgi:hypothetical protein